MDNSIDSKKCVVVYSGGLDSTVLLTKCKVELTMAARGGIPITVVVGRSKR